MLNDILARRKDIELICRPLHVRRLDVFGSAAGADFDPETSDIDFVVEFEDLPPAQYAEAYFSLLQSLRSLFNHAVDLVTAPSLTNPYFRQRVEQTKRLLYAA